MCEFVPKLNIIPTIRISHFTPRYIPKRNEVYLNKDLCLSVAEQQVREGKHGQGGTGEVGLPYFPPFPNPSQKLLGAPGQHCAGPFGGRGKPPGI